MALPRTFNEVPEKTERGPQAGGDGTRPGDQLNTKANAEWWHNLLTKHGWKDVSRPNLQTHGIFYFQRPGKLGRTPSATYGMTGDCLYVFSSNALPFEADTAYKPFAAYTLLEHGGNFQAAAKALAQQGYGFPPQRPAATAGPEPSDTLACPELPPYAKTDKEAAAEASLWLDDYIAFSKTWAPRGYEGFHQACGLFILSTAAARRIRVDLGPHGVYTSLYQALAARTSLYTKTTVVDLAIELLSKAGLGFLLANDDATPQAFLRSLTLYVPDRYGDASADEQQQMKNRLAFTAQRGWFYEEWGQHLSSMMQKEGHMASFRSILRRLDDHKSRFTYETISRGEDVLIKPYVSLLANVTPADLKPFIKQESPLWRDGYVARFTFIAPGDTPPNNAEFPKGTPKYPASLLLELRDWHQRLGLPAVSIEPICDKKGQETGKFKASITRVLPEQTYTLHESVWKAYYAYDKAMRALAGSGKDENLDGSYVRFPIKALRIAALLASLHDSSNNRTVHLRHWHRGQQIAEQWRQDLHQLLKQLHDDVGLSHERKQEDRIVSVLRKHNGTMTQSDLRRYTKWSMSQISEVCRTLAEAHVLTREDSPRGARFTLNGAAGDF